MASSTQRTQLTPSQQKTLVRDARKAAKHAHVPYSKFRVGAAVRAASGNTYLGANIENASYGLGTCAERVALAAAQMAGETKIVAIAIACVDAPAESTLEGRMPCGACRQWIQELAPQATIVIHGAPKTYTIGDLLPQAFKLTSK